GATLIPVDGRTSDCCRLADRLARERGWVNLTTTYHNPYGVDAYATIAFEIAHIDADVVLLPISSGPLLAGIMKGFQTLLARGRIKRVPRAIAVQAEACAPIARAYREGDSIRAWPHQTTVASALNDTLEGYERDGDYTLDWIRRFDGAAVAVDDQTILKGARTLAETEGILTEPSAAVPIAALDLLRNEGLVRPDDRVIAVATGHGLKDLSWIQSNPASTPLRPDFAALARVLETVRL
ncbi:pyridoxal-phosphate dependent enzyme, partial [Nitratireductor sp. GCM10026969]|uniref:pyridoxal-phosphate dependent enzyme n=1 Tax=Nitratireductor sp. GCM10026969 TaxID=3252645 RepID=UPI00361A98AA